MTELSPDPKAVRLRLAVDLEQERLERSPRLPPIGGWYSRAIENIACTEGMNPYTLDRIIRGIA